MFCVSGDILSQDSYLHEPDYSRIEGKWPHGYIVSENNIDIETRRVWWGRRSDIGWAEMIFSTTPNASH